MNPKVLITTNTLEFGGAERQRVALANNLAAFGADVLLVMLQSGGPLERELRPDVRLRSRSWLRPARAPAGTLVVSGATNTEVAFSGMMRAFSHRTGWVTAIHTVNQSGRTFGQGLAAAVRRSDGAVYLSEGHRALVQEHQRLDNGNYWVIPNGIQAQQARQADRRCGQAPKIAFIGRLVPGKGVATVLDALGGLLHLAWTFDVVGDGPSREELASIAMRRGISDRVRFHGWARDVSPFLADADILVLPSRQEALPMVLLEAMASGVAVVANPVGSIPELLDGGCGVVVDPPSVKSWTEVLAHLLDHPEERAQLGENGWQRIRDRFSLEAMTKGYIRIWEELLG